MHWVFYLTAQKTKLHSAFVYTIGLVLGIPDAELKKVYSSLQWPCHSNMRKQLICGRDDPITILSLCIMQSNRAVVRFLWNWSEEIPNVQLTTVYLCKSLSYSCFDSDIWHFKDAPLCRNTLWIVMMSFWSKSRLQTACCRSQDSEMVPSDSESLRDITAYHKARYTLYFSPRLNDPAFDLDEQRLCSPRSKAGSFSLFFTMTLEG